MLLAQGVQKEQTKSHEAADITDKPCHIPPDSVTSLTGEADEPKQEPSQCSTRAALSPCSSEVYTSWSQAVWDEQAHSEHLRE